MQSKIPLRWSLFIVGAMAIAFSSLVFYFLIVGTSVGSVESAVIINSPERSSPEQSSSGLPIRLQIPKLNIDTVIEQVGLTKDGAMGVPEGPIDVAWFDLGPRPGDKGSAVIAGHDGWKDNIRAVFDDLHKLQIGDKIYVEDKEGTTTAFVVREIRTYGQNDDASDVFGSEDGKAHLNLITCGGIWSKTEKSYSNRLVVFADKGSP